MATENSTRKPRIAVLPAPAEPQSITAVRDAMTNMAEIGWSHMVGIASGMLSEAKHDPEDVVIHLMRIMSEETRREFLIAALAVDAGLASLANRRKAPILTTCS